MKTRERETKWRTRKILPTTATANSLKHLKKERKNKRNLGKWIDLENKAVQEHCDHFEQWPSKVCHRKDTCCWCFTRAMILQWIWHFELHGWRSCQKIDK